MKKALPLVFLCFFVLFFDFLKAQTPVKAPVITYPGPNAYIAGTAIAPLLPVNTGGLVPAGYYGQTSTIVTGSSGSTNIVIDTAHNMYYYDNSYVIRKVAPAGVSSVFAGSGNAGSANGKGTAASFGAIAGLAIDAAGNIYVADNGNNTIRKISPYGVVTTLAGKVGVAGAVNGAANVATFNYPSGVAVDAAGNVYVTEYSNNDVRKISAGGLVSTLAGNTSGGYADGTGAAANFYAPQGIVVDAAGNLYVSDSGNEVIRKVTAAGDVTTIAGSPSVNGSTDGTGAAASFYNPTGIALDSSGNLYVADTYNLLIRKISPAKVVTTLAGGGTNYSDGTGASAGFSSPQGIYIDPSGNLYVSDGGSIRKVQTTGYSNSPLPAGLTFNPSDGSISGTPLLAKATATYTVTAYNTGGISIATVAITVTGTLSTPTNPVHPPQITYAGPQSYVAGVAINSLVPVNSGDAVPAVGYGQTSTFATGFGPAQGMVTDAAHNLYFADYQNHVIKQISPTGVISIFAGSGSAGSVNGTGTAASFATPMGLAIDASGNIYVADGTANLIRKITPNGTVSTFAGNGMAGHNDGAGAIATFNAPAGIATDNYGNIYVTETGNSDVRKLNSAGVVSTLAGNGQAGSINGTGTAATFNQPSGVAIDALGNVYVVDSYGQLIRKITASGIVTTLAGSGNQAYTDGAGTAASFSYPTGLAIDGLGNLYVSDTGNVLIRKVTPVGLVTTLAGGAASSQDGVGAGVGFGSLYGLTIDGAGMIYASDGNAVRKISAVGYVSVTLPIGLTFDPSTGIISGTPLVAKAAANYNITGYNTGGSSTAAISVTVTGTPAAPATVTAPVISYAGPKTYPTGAAITALVPANGGGSIPANLFGQTSTFAGSGAMGSSNGNGAFASFNHPGAVATDAYGNIYIADHDNNLIRKISATGIVSTLAGSGTAGYLDGTGAAASFFYPTGIAVDITGTVYVADSYNQVIRKISPAGVVTTLAGTAGSPGSANGTGLAASFNYPTNLAIDASKNLYVADSGNGTIRKITAAGVVTTLAGTAGNTGADNGTGPAASFSNPVGIAVDASGNVFVGDQYNNLIRKITPAGVVTTFAGNATAGYIDGTGAAAVFNSPAGLTIDKAGNLYVADVANNLVRKITKTGLVSTLAGNETAGAVNGLGPVSSFNGPQGVAADALGNVYVADQTNNLVRKITATGYTTDNTLPAGLTLDGTTGTISGTPLPRPLHSYHTSHAISILTKAVSEQRPYDLLVTDLYFEDEGSAKQLPDGMELIRKAKILQPELKVLVFSAESKIVMIRRLYEELAIDGYVRKARGDSKELKDALEQLAQNRRYYPREYRSLAAQENKHDFTDRDKAIIRLLNEGYSQMEIADWLELNGMPPFGLSSVEKRLKLMRTAMNFTKNMQLIGFCKDLGMI